MSSVRLNPLVRPLVHSNLVSGGTLPSLSILGTMYPLATTPFCPEGTTPRLTETSGRRTTLRLNTRSLVTQGKSGPAETSGPPAQAWLRAERAAESKGLGDFRTLGASLGPQVYQVLSGSDPA